MDNLAYTYDTSIGDRLAKVEDASGNPEGFKDTNATTDYSYDDNGNLRNPIRVTPSLSGDSDAPKGNIRLHEQF